METKQLVESQYVSVQVVKDSPTKKLIILSSGALAMSLDNQLKFQLLTEIDGKQKTWRPNVATLKAIHAAWGTESTAWIGKTVTLTIGNIRGKEAIIGQPT